MWIVKAALKNPYAVVVFLAPQNARPAAGEDGKVTRRHEAHTQELDRLSLFLADVVLCSEISISRRIMAVTLDLSRETERRLRELAAKAGLTLEGYLQSLVEREAAMGNGIPSMDMGRRGAPGEGVRRQARRFTQQDCAVVPARRGTRPPGGAGIAVAGRPDCVFIKLHTHGAKEANTAMLLGEPMRDFHRALASYARGRDDFASGR